jgi:hypothetical protein
VFIKRVDGATLVFLCISQVVAKVGDGVEGPVIMFVEAKATVVEAVMTKVSVSAALTIAVCVVVVIGLECWLFVTAMVGATVTIGAWMCWAKVRVSEVPACVVVRGFAMKAASSGAVVSEGGMGGVRGRAAR